jgi:hypothetical protein
LNAVLTASLESTGVTGDDGFAIQDGVFEVSGFRAILDLSQSAGRKPV